jgi:two-component system response regulator MprA
MPLARILVVDDEPRVAGLLRDALVELGYGAEIALNGPDALARILVYEPDIVLLDVLMPGMSGVEVLERLRCDHPAVAVIMVTANQDEAAARAMLARGAFDYVPKPFDLRVIERVVCAAVGARGRR